MKFKTILKFGLLILIGFTIAIFSIAPLRSQIQQIAGLAVAQTPTRWNNVKDAAVGDNQTNGLLANGNYVWDPTTASWLMLRGTAAGALTVGPQQSALLVLLNAVAAPTVGATNNIGFIVSKMTWEIVITGAPANETTLLEGSINGTTWYTLDTCTTVTSEMRHIGFKPVNYIRGNCTVLPGGTCTVRFIGGGN